MLRSRGRAGLFARKRVSWGGPGGASAASVRRASIAYDSDARGAPLPGLTPTDEPQRRDEATWTTSMLSRHAPHHSHSTGPSYWSRSTPSSASRVVGSSCARLRVAMRSSSSTSAPPGRARRSRVPLLAGACRGRGRPDRAPRGRVRDPRTRREAAHAVPRGRHARAPRTPRTPRTPGPGARARGLRDEQLIECAYVDLLEQRPPERHCARVSRPRSV